MEEWRERIVIVCALLALAALLQGFYWAVAVNLAAVVALVVTGRWVERS